MKIYTSYFDNIKIENNRVFISIAGKSPEFFTNLTNENPKQFKSCKKLAPKYIWWKEWHDKKLSNEWYIEKYNETVLSKLNAQEIFNEWQSYGNEIVLLCWEGRNEFCHRHLVANWLSKELNIEVNELE